MTQHDQPSTVRDAFPVARWRSATPDDQLPDLPQVREVVICGAGKECAGILGRVLEPAAGHPGWLLLVPEYKHRGRGYWVWQPSHRKAHHVYTTSLDRPAVPLVIECPLCWLPCRVLSPYDRHAKRGTRQKVTQPASLRGRQETARVS